MSHSAQTSAPGWSKAKTHRKEKAMQHVDSNTITNAREASLGERFQAFGHTPISQEYIDEHKADELAKCPRPTRFPRALKRIAGALLEVPDAAVVVGVTGLLGVIVFAIFGWPLIWPLSALVGGWATAFVIARLNQRLDKIVVRDQAKWVTVSWEKFNFHIPHSLMDLVPKVRSISPSGSIELEVLFQNSKVLDPVWWVVEGNERVCFAITDEFGRLIKAA